MNVFDELQSNIIWNRAFSKKSYELVTSYATLEMMLIYNIPTRFGLSVKADCLRSIEPNQNYYRMFKFKKEK